MTILFQDAGITSLQVFHDSQWIDIPPKDGTFVINVGDMLQVFSNDRYKAPLHRVLTSPDTTRFSAAFFYNPAYSCMVEPLPVGEDGSRYTRINWAEFRKARFAGDYSDGGEEVQISWYRHILES